mmetsp:Transcript_24235/g.62548  ORF Transcript_24235/g.62548 Transcript_24235/m.62548 type:complete len:241 (+) Transcript_24235:325-1047(+)
MASCRPLVATGVATKTPHRPDPLCMTTLAPCHSSSSSSSRALLCHLTLIPRAILQWGLICPAPQMSAAQGQQQQQDLPHPHPTRLLFWRSWKWCPRVSLPQMCGVTSMISLQTPAAPLVSPASPRAANLGRVQLLQPKRLASPLPPMPAHLPPMSISHPSRPVSPPPLQLHPHVQPMAWGVLWMRAPPSQARMQAQEQKEMRVSCSTARRSGWGRPAPYRRSGARTSLHPPTLVCSPPAV